MVPPGKPLNGLKQEKKKVLNVSFVKSELSLKCENINILTRTSLKNVAIHCERLLEEGSDMKRDKPGGGGGAAVRGTGLRVMQRRGKVYCQNQVGAACVHSSLKHQLHGSEGRRRPKPRANCPELSDTVRYCQVYCDW